MSRFEFRVRYWGTMGTFTRPPKPTELLQKISGAIRCLQDQDALASLGPLNDEELHQKLVELLPFWLRTGYGGNTTCVEIETPDALIILDSGSGFRELGIEVARRWSAADWQGPREAHVLLTHAHMDHTFATPFFDPYYDPRNRIHLTGPKSAIDSLDFVLSPSSPLRTIYFPITYEAMGGVGNVRSIEAGDEFTIGQTCISTFALNHPGGCVAYRLKRGDKTLVFASDHEHEQVPDEHLAAFAQGADLLYMDAQYLEDEYEGRTGIGGAGGALSRRGWGHSTIDAAVATGIAARARHLHLGHHEPKRTDKELHEVARLAQRLSELELRRQGRAAADCRTRLAAEGLEIEI